MKVRSSHNGAVQPVGCRLWRRGGLHFLFQCAGDIVRAMDRAIVVDVAIDIHEFMNQKLEKALLFCQRPKQRKEILQEMGLVNNVKNYDTYIAPLVEMQWINMTIPDKPTSPKQQYRTSLKGGIVIELLNYIDEE